MSVHRFRSGPAVPLLAFVAVAVSVSAQTPQTSPPAIASAAKSASALPRARQVIDRHVSAVGGRAAVLAHSSTHATGSISIPSAGMTGMFELFAAKPNKHVLKITLGGVGDLQEGFDGENGWSISAMTGPTLLRGKELEQKRFDSDFYGDLHPEDRYESMTTVEKLTFEGHPCYKLRLVRKGGGEDFEFYDAETGLKAGSITTRETPMGELTATTIETDYRRFGATLQATTIRQTIMGLQQVVTLSAVEYDQVDSSVFDPPAPIKALLK